MAVINLGRVGYVHKGAYAAATTYQKYDVVLYNHGSYLYIGDTASSGHAPTDTAYWQAMLDPSAMQEATEAAVAAADAAHASAMELAGQVDRLTTPFSITGDMVNCHPVSDYPLGVISHIEPVQAGSGDPSPSNVRPISGWTGAILTRTGKNLFDQSAYLTNDVTLNNWYYTTLKMRPNTTYTMSCDIPEAGKDYVALFAFNSGDSASGAKNQVYKERPVQITTLDDGIIKIQYRKTSATYNVLWYKYQIELGSTATAYEPYQGNQYTVQFDQTIYGGELDWKTGVLKVTHCKIIFDGVSDGARVYHSDGPGTQYGYLHPYEMRVPFKQQGNISSNKLVFSDDPIYSAQGVGITTVLWLKIPVELTGIQENDSSSVIIAKTNNVLNQWYEAGEPLEVVYELAAPTSVQLTPQQILSLAGENNLWSDAGETTVNGPNSPKVMENRIAALEAAIANMA